MLGVAVALVLALSACATAGGIRNEPLTHGVARSFSYDHDRVLAAARAAVLETGLEVQEVTAPDERTTMIIATKGRSAFSHGELVRVVVQRADSLQTTVRVVSKRRVAINITAKGDYSKSIFAVLDRTLK